MKKIVLKISGESLQKDTQGSGFSIENVYKVASDLKYLYNFGFLLLIVLGGGNFLRGAQHKEYNISRLSVDSMGMIATIINSLALCDALKKEGVPSVLYSTIQVGNFCEEYSVEKAENAFKDRNIVIVGGGTGIPYFSTDTSAAIRAIEHGADWLIKLTKVDGVYNEDPVANSRAILYNEISYDEFLIKKINVMDLSAVTLCRDFLIPIYVLNMKHIRKLSYLIDERSEGTVIY
ncbi:MAG: UMP kinase [Deltaproteobacteria bacterium]|nr:MAG: UMP kinase [Deltaproteobacteria bacterium]